MFCARLQPLYTPSTTSLPNAPLPSPVVRVVLSSYDSHDWNQSSDALTAWLNARWAKSGYSVSRETVCFTLRSHDRNAVMGKADEKDGAFLR
jgi:hypothetical protein